MPDHAPAPLTDDELRETAANGWAPHGARLATELLAARARIAQLELRLEPPGSPRLEKLIQQLGIDMTEPMEILAEKVAQQRARIGELETAATMDGAVIRQANADREDQAKSIAHLARELDAARSRVAELGAELVGVRARVADLEERGAKQRDRIAVLEADHGRLVDATSSNVRRFSATLDERDALRARVTELEGQVAVLADAEMERARLSLYARNARRTIRTLWKSRRHWQNRAAELEAEHGLADRVTEALDRIEVNRALEAAQPYREVQEARRV